MMVMMSIYKGRPRWAWRSNKFTQSQESLLPQDQPANPMYRLIERLGVNKFFVPVINIVNVAIAVVAAALLIWNGVCLLAIYPLNNYRLKLIVRAGIHQETWTVDLSKPFRWHILLILSSVPNYSILSYSHWLYTSISKTFLYLVNLPILDYPHFIRFHVRCWLRVNAQI